MDLKHIYIISWFGKDPILKDFRRSIHKRQLEWCKTNNLKVTVLAQEYEEFDYQSDVEYIHTDKFLRPCGARNVILQKFYDSSDDFAIFVDNDTILQDTNWGEPNKFLTKIRELNKKYTDQIDFIAGIHPATQAFNEELSRPEYNSNIIFRRTHKFNGGFFILKNFKKLKNLEFWFDDENFTDKNGNLIPNEESDFCIQLLMSGQNCFQNFEALFNDMSNSTKSTWASTANDRVTDRAWFSNLINSKYQRELITLLNADAKLFNYIGYSRKTDKLELRFCADKNHRVHAMTIDGQTDITFYSLPQPMSIHDARIWAKNNTTDPILLDAIDRTKHKDFKRLSKPRTKFNWERLNHNHPLNLIIPTKENSLFDMFEFN